MPAPGGEHGGKEGPVGQQRVPLSRGGGGGGGGGGGDISGNENDERLLSEAKGRLKEMSRQLADVTAQASVGMGMVLRR